jgi:hypothetical protein
MQGHPLFLPVKKDCSVDILDISFWISGGIPRYFKTDESPKVVQGSDFQRQLELDLDNVQLGLDTRNWAQHMWS